MQALAVHSCRRRFAGALLVFCCVTCACHRSARRHAVTLSLTVPVISYLQAGSDAERFRDFPVLEIFDRAGEPIYLGHDAIKNADLLRSLPRSLDGLKALPGHQTLSSFLDTIPGVTKKDRNAFLENPRLTVLTVSLADCHACSVQEQAIGPELENRLSAKGVNLLMIRFSHPE